MRQLFVFLIVFLLLPRIALSSETDSKLSEIVDTRKNTDGSHTIVKKNSQSVFFVFLKTNSIEELKIQIAPKEDEVNLPFFAVALIDFDRDGFWDLEKTGACGNKVCEKRVYRFNPPENKFIDFFEGAYSELSVFDQHLIEFGGTGCCAAESHAYRIKNYETPINRNDSYLIISVTSSPKGKLPICTFSTSEGLAIKVPSKKWLRLCERYGKKYKLIAAK